MPLKPLHPKNTPVTVTPSGLGRSKSYRGYYQKPGRYGGHFVSVKKGGRAGWWLEAEEIRRSE